MCEPPAAAYRLDNYVWFSTSSALMLAGPFFVVLILSRLGTPRELGLYAYAYAVTAPVQAFAGLHSRAFIAMDRLFGYRVEDLLAQRVYLGAILVFTALAVTTAQAGQHDVWVFLGVVLVRIAEGFADVSAGQFQRFHKPRLIAVAYGFRVVFGLATFTALLAAQLPLELALAGMGFVNVLAFFVLDRVLLGSIGAAPILRAAVISLASVRPLGLGLRLLPGALLAALSVVEVNLPRYVVEAFRGVAAVGVYTTLGMLLSVGTNVVHPVFFMTFARLGQAAQRHDAESRRYLVRLIWTNIALTVGGGIMLVTLCAGFGSAILAILFGSDWTRFGELFGVLAIGAAASLLRSCLGFALTSLNVFAPQIVITLLSSAAFVLLAVELGGQTDILGVALAAASASLLAVGANGLILGAVLRRHRGVLNRQPLAIGAHLGGEQ